MSETLIAEWELRSSDTALTSNMEADLAEVARLRSEPQDMKADNEQLVFELLDLVSEPRALPQNGTDNGRPIA